MTEKQRLLKVKANLKRRQPKFIRQDAHKHKRVKQVWRAPKGLHSKIKDSKKGYRAKLQEGYHTPKAVRGMDKHGLYPTIVATVAELKKLDPAKHSVIVSGTLGNKKRVVIIEEAAKHKFTLSNVTVKKAEDIKAKFTKSTQERKAREVSKKEKQKAAVEKADKKKAKADDADVHEHKHDEKHDHKKDPKQQHPKE
jgi:large subunit ribosomal protein L32e